MWHKLIKKVLSLFIGGSAIATPILCSCTTTNQVSLESQPKTFKSEVVNDEINDYGITLSTYELEGWTGSSSKIQVFNKNSAVVENVTWITSDNSKVTVDPTPVDGYYTVHWSSSWYYDLEDESKNIAKITARFTDSDGHIHNSVCQVKLIHGNTPTYKNTSSSKSYDIFLKQGEETTLYFDLYSYYSQEQQGNPGHKNSEFFKLAYDTSQLVLFQSGGISYTSGSNPLKLVLKANTNNIFGRISFTFYDSVNDPNKEHALQVNVQIAKNDLQISNSNISARLNDSVSLTSTLNETATTSTNVTWTTSTPDICSFEQDATVQNKINLKFHKTTSEPIVLYCYETDVTEPFVYKKCYVNITNSNLLIQQKTKTEYLRSEKQTVFTATIDGNTPEPNKIFWSTSDSKILSIDNTGTAFFINAGAVTVTATYITANKATIQDSFNITIKNNKFETTQQVIAFLNDVPEKIVAKLDDIVVEDPTKLIYVSDDPQIVSVDDNGQLHYNGCGQTQVHCYYTDLLFHEPGYEAVTTVKIAAPELEYTLEWYEKRVGTKENPNIHSLPKAYIGGVEIPLNKLVWTSNSPTITIDGLNGTFVVSVEGEYILTCAYNIGEEILTKDVSILVQDYFVNNFVVKEPTITSDATTFVRDRTFQLEFWFDDARTQTIQIKSCISTNTKRAEVNDAGLIKFKGHGKCDIICTLIYVNANDEPATIETIVHLKIVVWWWAWLIIGVVGATILFLIIFFSVRKSKKNKNQKSKTKDKKGKK